MSTPEIIRLSTKTMSKRNKRYWFRLIRLFLILLLAIVMALPVCFGIFSITALVYANCSDSNTNPSDFGAITWEPFSINATAGGTFDGYFIEGTNGITIIFPPNFNVGRGWRLREASVLFKNGYSVVTFESRRCADMGPMSLGYQEVEEVHDVINYLRERGDVDLSRLGIHGFSSSGATAIIATARYPEIKAVVAEGGYADMDALVRDHTGDIPLFAGKIYYWSMRQTYRAVIGNKFETLNTLNVINQIAPRPLLLVYGSTEVTLDGAKAQFEAAGSNAELWVVEGAGHGNYLNVAPQEYESRMLSFFDAAFLVTD
jgi:dienelactone hydrolase